MTEALKTAAKSAAPAASALPSNPIVMIPARMASTRLPQKPLADIHGLPMIVHVMKRAEEAILQQLWHCNGIRVTGFARAIGGHAQISAVIFSTSSQAGTQRQAVRSLASRDLNACS